MSVCGSWCNITSLLLFQTDWSRPVSTQTSAESCYYNIHKDYIFQVWVTVGEWFSNFNYQGNQLRQIWGLLGSLRFCWSRMGPQESAALTRSRWLWCSIWGSTCREPLLWGRFPPPWAIRGQSRSFRARVENEFSFSGKWLSYLLSEAPVQRWVWCVPTRVAGTTQATSFRFLLLLPF